jgi:beta-lactamase regulating signal transducer with metallopeptidase domain
MTDIFAAVLNMSLTAAFVIAALCLARLVLKRLNAPKWISYALWAVAGFRLAVPFTIESVFSLLPSGIPQARANPRTFSTVAPNDVLMRIADGDLPITILDSYPVRADYTMEDVVACIWLVGAAAMLLYAVISYVLLIKRKDSVATPFVYGFFKPKIHIPGGLAGEQLRCVTLHEQTHIKRRDHIVKLFAFALLCVHWFNPLAWVAFVLLCADMEMSCDERVLRELGMDVKADYSQTLLSLSMNRRILSASPLAFGEGGIKERVKNVLNFKKRSRVIIIVAVALVAVLSMGFAVDRAADKSDWAAFEMPEANYDGVFFKTDREAYNPEFISISGQLMNNQRVMEFTSDEYYTLVKQSEGEWKAVPFADNIGFNDIAYILSYGDSQDYHITPELLAVKLDEGKYRIVADVYEQTADNPIKHTVWTEFSIDKNAEKQESFDGDIYLENLNSEEMTLDDMKRAATQFVAMNRYLTILDLADYKSINFSSDTRAYLLYYSVENDFTLIGRANETGAFESMTLRRNSDGATLDAVTEWERIDDFVNGSYTPEAEPAYEESRQMTVDDARAVNQNLGADLTLNDLNGFKGWLVGEPSPETDFYTMHYDIDDGTGEFMPMYVTATAMDTPVTSCSLRRGYDNAFEIDIRYYDIDAFLNGEKKLIAATDDTPPTLTLDDVRLLAKLGDKLTIDDLSEFDRRYFGDDSGGAHFLYPIMGGKWEFQVNLNNVDGELLMTDADLRPVGFEFSVQDQIDIRRENVDKYISYIEAYDGSQTRLTAAH